MSFKIDEFVDFPIDGLDMEERCDERRVAKTLVAQGKDLEKYGIDGNLEPLVYDLCKWYSDMGLPWLTSFPDAVDNHYGGMGGGHYTATCKNMQDGKWYKYDDSHVSPAAGEADIKVSGAFGYYSIVLNTAVPRRARPRTSCSIEGEPQDQSAASPDKR